MNLQIPEDFERRTQEANTDLWPRKPSIRTRYWVYHPSFKKPATITTQHGEIVRTTGPLGWLKKFRAHEMHYLLRSRYPGYRLLTARERRATLKSA